VLIIPVIFDSLGDLIPWIRHRFFDDVLIRIDYNLFGGRHPTVMLEWFIHPLLTTILQFAYISYYPMAVVLGVVLFMKKKRKEFDETIFGIILCFYLSYLGYLLVPAVGPRFTLVQLQTRDLQAGPLVVAIQETLNALENTKTDAFPSGHTAVALMTLYYAWKTREKTLTVLLLPTVLGLILSTVYLRYHYVIDVVAGVLLAAFTIYLAPRAYKRLSSSSDEQPQG
jgi:membrane-associated phospholipid phosphatase